MNEKKQSGYPQEDPRAELERLMQDKPLKRPPRLRPRLLLRKPNRPPGSKANDLQGALFPDTSRVSNGAARCVYAIQRYEYA